MRDDARRFLTMILDGDRRRAERFARDVFEQRGAQFLYEELVRPALREVGELWRTNSIHIADEHLATATAEAAVAALYPRFPWPPPGPKALVGCVEGERHQLGARMVADLLALDGWDERFIGGDVPSEDLVRMVREVAPRLLGLSVTLPDHVDVARAAIARVREAAPDVKILVGGRAAAPDIEIDAAACREVLGADAIARSAPEAVEVARGWK